MKSHFHCAILFISIVLTACHPIPQPRRSIPRAEVEGISIQSEIHGPFSKNQIEVIFSNPTNRDSAEGRLHFSTNRNSFVTDMWLEIDGKLEHAETFHRTTGQRIYNRIVGRRLDPALLTASSGRHTLRVFPVQARGRRRVLLQHYSVIGTDHEDVLSWRFRTSPKVPIHGSFTMTLPPNVSYEVKREYFPVAESSITVQDTGNMEIRFRYDELNWPLAIGDDSLVFEMVPGFLVEVGSDTAQSAVVLPSVMNGIGILDTLIDLALSGPSVVYIQRVFAPPSNNFYSAMNHYLEAEYGMKTVFKSTWDDVISRWMYANGQWEYRNLHFKLVNPRPADSRDEKIFRVPDLQLHLAYNDILRDKDVLKHVAAEFLTPHTAKLVLEKERRTRRIRREALQAQARQLEGRNLQGEKPLPPPPDAVIRFIPYDNPPEPIGGHAAIQSKVIFPSCEGVSLKEGRVELQCFVEATGEVIRTVPLVTIGSEYTIAAATAIKLTPFKPAMQRDRPVGVWISIPVEFELKGKNQSKQFAEENRYLNYNGREFSFQTIQDRCIPVEKGFEPEEARKIEYLSKEQLELAIQHLELIPLFYSLEDVGLRVNDGEDFILIWKEKTTTKEKTATDEIKERRGRGRRIR
ncbi:VIT domain-containing protein [Candidatus Neomarinimicrobiota bacterium]